MKNVLVTATLLLTLLVDFGVAHAADAPPPLDVVTLKDGSVIYGEVIEMAGGLLVLQNPASPDNAIKIKWSDVAKLAVNHPIPFHLKEGTVLIGTATAGADGNLNIQSEPLKGSLTVPLDAIGSVNPLVQPPVIYTGSLTGGYSQGVVKMSVEIS